MIEFIEAKNRHVDCGMIGFRCISHVLFENDEGSLAYEMITREDELSYGSMIKRGGTALFEALEANGVQESQNLHFFGNILNLFISRLVGLIINPDMTDVNHILVAPHMVDEVEEASASSVTAKGTISASWKRDKENIQLEVMIPEGIYGEVIWQQEKHLLKVGRNVFGG